MHGAYHILTKLEKKIRQGRHENLLCHFTLYQVATILSTISDNCIIESVTVKTSLPFLLHMHEPYAFFGNLIGCHCCFKSRAKGTVSTRHIHVKAIIGRLDCIVRGVPVADHKALKFELITQNRRQHALVFASECSIDFVVCAHDRRYVGFHGTCKWPCINFMEHPIIKDGRVLSTPLVTRTCAAALQRLLSLTWCRCVSWVYAIKCFTHDI